MPQAPETADEEVKSKVEELIGDKLSQLLEEGGLKMEVKGLQTSIQGKAMTEVKGPLVKIN